MNNLLHADTLLKYEISMPKPHTHYFEVEMTIENWNSENLDLKMAAWTPGSYLMREYAKNVEGFLAKDGKGNELKTIKTKKNTWSIETSKAKTIIVNYSVYAYELSVRTCFLDDSYGYISGAGLFMYIADHLELPSIVSINPYNGWEKVSTALPSIANKNNTFTCDNFDVLVDSPILIGNQEEYSFTACGIPHRLAMQGPGNYNPTKLTNDLKTVVETTAKVINDTHPCKDYLFIVLASEGMKGGLEHLNSTTLIYPRWAYNDPKYFDFISLACHEYFHLWNVKRIRPVELGPFNYEEENFTRQLWVAEGFTAYYDELLPTRAGFINGSEYIKKLETLINGVESLPGNQVQSLAESSLDAWIKYYRRNENSDNCCVSYYDKGAMAALTLDLMLRHNSGGKQSLDDVLKKLWKDYYLVKDIGYSEKEFLAVLNEVGGKDFTQVLDNYVYSCSPMPYQEVLGYVGLDIKAEPFNEKMPYMGMTTTNTQGKLIVNKVIKGTVAYEYGLNVNDEIIAINNIRVSSDMNEDLKRYKPGDTVEFTIARSSAMRTIKLQLDYNKTPVYKITKKPDATDAQKELFAQWTGQSMNLP